MIARYAHWYLTSPPLQFAGVVIASALLSGLLMCVHLRLHNGSRVACWRCIALCAVTCCAGAFLPGLMHFFDTVFTVLPWRTLPWFVVEVVIRLAMPGAALFACATLVRHTSSHHQFPRAAWLWPACSAASGFAFTILLLTLLRFDTCHSTMVLDAAYVRDILLAVLVVCLCSLICVDGFILHTRCISGLRVSFRSSLLFASCAAVLAAVLYVISASTGVHRSTLSMGGIVACILATLAFGAVVSAALMLSPRLLPAREHPCVCTVWASLVASVWFCFIYMLCR